MDKQSKRRIENEIINESIRKKPKLRNSVNPVNIDIQSKQKEKRVYRANKTVKENNAKSVRNKNRNLKTANTQIILPKRTRKKRENLKETSGVAKNQCVCDSIDEEPIPSQLLEDHEAHVLVDEWRLQKFQSPIELRHDESITHDHFESLEFYGHWEKVGEATFTNTGKTAILRFQEREAPYLIGGPLHKDTYVFEQLHFHWSDDDISGCEHIFEGLALIYACITPKQSQSLLMSYPAYVRLNFECIRYSMEAHAVHYNKKYSSFEEAQDKHDGLAVIGFFLEATDHADNPCFSKLASAVQDIAKVGSTTNVAADSLTWIKEEAQCRGYYTYQGSLTTEPYLESVTWILYPTPIHVSRQQVAYFRELKSCPCEKTNITNNVRPIQTPPPDRKPNILFARSHRKSE